MRLLLKVCIFLCICAKYSSVQKQGYTTRFLNDLGLPSPYQSAQHYGTEIVKLKVFYESMCPDCRQFFRDQLVPVMARLSDSLDVDIIPYGKARTYWRGGRLVFKCQHGPAEWYGNMLHACAIDMLRNSSAAVLFTACLMEPERGRGSDDVAADLCGTRYGINAETIKQCAKSDKGSWLLKLNGDKTNLLDKYVPYTVINEVPVKTEHLLRDVCRAFRDPPAGCNDYLH